MAAERWLRLGDFCAIDIAGNFVVDWHIDLEELGWKVGVLAE